MVHSHIFPFVVYIVVKLLFLVTLSLTLEMDI